MVYIYISKEETCLCFMERTRVIVIVIKMNNFPFLN